MENRSDDRHRLAARLRSLDPLAGDARPDRTSRPTSSPPSARGSRPRAGAPGCSRSRRRTACGPADAWSQDWTDTFHVAGAPAAARARSRERAGPAGRSASSASTSPGATAHRWNRHGPTTGSSRARSSRASTATSSRPAPTSAWTWRRSSTGCSVSSSPTAAGTARSRTARRCPRSGRRSTSSRACSSMSGRSAARPRWPRRGGVARSTCSSAVSSVGSRPAR